MSRLSDHARQVIGPDRRDRLIQAYADRLVLHDGWQPAVALPYARAAWDSGHSACFLARGQTWEHREHGNWFTIADIDHTTGQVDGGSGVILAFETLTVHYRLIDWPPGEHLPPPAAQPDPVVEDTILACTFHGLPAGRLPVRITRAGSTRHLAMQGGHWSTTITHTAGQPYRYPHVTHWTELALTGYLNQHLADFRSGFDAWAQLRQPSDDQWLDFFNDFDGDDGILDYWAPAAYTRVWLFERIRGDVVARYGGTVADYEVLFLWGEHYLNTVIPHVHGFDPCQPLPADHRLAQLPGQLTIADLM